MSWWDDKAPSMYTAMLRNHRKLWDYIIPFIDENKVKRILEVGAGAKSPILKLVKKGIITRYQAIDLNITVDALHTDFTKLATQQFKGEFDLLLAAAVIEHCDGYEEFLEKVKNAGVKYAIITFFNGLDRDVETRQYYVAHKTKVWRNFYSKDGVERKLEELGLDGKYKIFTPSGSQKDTLLLINF